MYDFKIERVLRRYGVLFDTELLVVLCVGAYRPALVEKFTKTAGKYEIADYKQLVAIIKLAKTCFISPQLLAELSNHLDKLREPDKTQVYRTLKELIKTQFEVYVAKDDIVQEAPFHKLGFADTSTLRICRDKKCLLITADYLLNGILRKERLYSVNYNHILGQHWLPTS